QHDRDPIAPLQLRGLLQPSREVSRQTIVFCIGDRLVHAGEGRELGETLTAFFEDRDERGVLVRVDLSRYALRVVLEPNLFHYQPPDLIYYFVSVARIAGQTLSSSRRCASADG